MNRKNQLFYLMQLAGGTFPSGGFSQSWGLETYVSSGKVSDTDSLIQFIESYLFSTAARSESPIVCSAHRLGADLQIELIEELECFSTAIKLTKESRESSIRMGKAFIRIASAIMEDTKLTQTLGQFTLKGLSYPVAYGLICGHLELDIEDTLSTFVFNAVNGLVQAAVKLIPLGNTEGQKVLVDLQESMALSVKIAQEIEMEDISNFCPGLDIASMQHEVLPVRLYMS